MNNPEFLALIRHLGDDVGYMSLRVQRDITKCVADFRKTEDVKRFCRKLAGILIKFSEYACSYARTLEDRIQSHGLQDEYSDILITIKQLTRKEENVSGQCQLMQEKVEEPQLNGTAETNLEDIPQNLRIDESSDSDIEVISSETKNAINDQSDSGESQKTVPNDEGVQLSQLLTSQEFTPSSGESQLTVPNEPPIESEPDESLLSQEGTVPNDDDHDDYDSDATVINLKQTETENPKTTDNDGEVDQSQIFTPQKTIEPEEEASVEVEVRSILEKVLNSVCVNDNINDCSQDVDVLLEELSQAISDEVPNNNNNKAGTSEKVDFFKTLEMVPSSISEQSDRQDSNASSDVELPKRKLEAKERITLLKIIKQFYMKRLRERRRKSPCEHESSSSDECIKEVEPRRKKRSKMRKSLDVNAAQGSNGDAIEGEPCKINENVAIIEESKNTQPPDPCRSEELSLELPVVRPFKRKKVLPLPCTQSSESHSTLEDSSQVVRPFKRTVRPLPSSQSELEADLEDLQQRKGVKRVRCSSLSDMDTSQEAAPKKRRRHYSESNPSCSQFKLDSKARDDFLKMLSSRPCSPEALTLTSDDSDVQLVSVESATPFTLTASDRDNLLKLLTDKEPDKTRDQTESTVQNQTAELVSAVQDPEPEKDVSLGLKEREELLELLEEANKSKSSKESTKSEGEDSVTSEKAPTHIQLSDEERNELMDLLTQHLHSIETISDAASEGVRDALLDLVREFEEAMSKGKGSLDNESPLLDLLREESVEVECEGKRGRGRPKLHNKDSWAAFEALLLSDDDFSDSSSSTELSDRDWKLSQRSSNREIGEARPGLTLELRSQFGVDKELVVDVERADLSQFDLSQFQNQTRRKDDNVDHLCDISTVLLKNDRRGGSSKRRKRLSSRSSSTAQSYSDIDLDSLISGSDGTSAQLSDDDDDNDQGRLADLWDTIRNSSDEDDSPQSDASNTSSNEDQKSDKKGKSSSDKEEEVGSGDGDKKKVELDSSDEEDFVGVRKGVAAWRRDPLLKTGISSTESDSEEASPPKLRVRKKKPINLDADSDGSDAQGDKPKTSPLKTFQVDDDSDSSDSDFEIVSVEQKKKTPLKVITLSDEEDSPSKRGKGRRNIRALMEEEDLAEATQRAHNEERERIKRLQEKDKAMESFTQSMSFASQLSEDECNPLILDVDDDTQIKVHPEINKKLKPHQRDGIQFMWDSCYESVKQLKAGYEGSGCILAHCMGLGKTLQALALIQTLFANPVANTKHVLVVCPLSTVSNWKNEYKLAYKGIKGTDVKFYSIEDKNAAKLRFDIVKKWWKHGGMLVLGYECFGLMVNEEKLQKWEDRGVFEKQNILRALIDPGPDLVICDEGHLLRNKQSQRTLALNKVTTKRRIVLTGTPLQNNLLEYYYMVNFVKPNLLGTEKEYKINFVNPINNGQFEDSTAEDIMFMKKRTHVLHKILNRTVQRVEDTELKRYLPKLIDQAVFVKLSDLQVKLYNRYLDSTNSRPVVYTKSGNINRKNFLADVQILQYICIHPNLLITAEKNAKAKIKEQDVIGDALEDELDEKVCSKSDWYKNLLSPQGSSELSEGSKILVALAIVEEAAANGDKVLIFSQSHAEMDNLEKFLAEKLHYKNKKDYYRMDGTVSPEVRAHMCDRFNSPSNRDIKVFIMSTKVGGLGLNLTAANRVVIMSVSWNPSYDTQSVFRAFRFGQNKAVYVYRLIAIDTMEEKMYQRGVTKLAIAHRVVDKHQITRHYNSADIQEYYSVRPTIDKARPVPNLPEDRVLAKLIQKHKVLFKWHEHQALLANRPEEDLDEHQKNAAWEEFNKKTDVPVAGNQYVPTGAFVNPQEFPNRVINPAAAQVAASQQSGTTHPDHTYSLSLPKTESLFMNQRTASADDFRPAPPTNGYVPRQIFDPAQSASMRPIRLGGNLTITSGAPAAGTGTLPSQKPPVTVTPIDVPAARRMEPQVRAMLMKQIKNSWNAVRAENSQQKLPSGACRTKVKPVLKPVAPRNAPVSTIPVTATASKSITPITAPVPKLVTPSCFKTIGPLKAAAPLTVTKTTPTPYKSPPPLEKSVRVVTKISPYPRSEKTSPSSSAGNGGAAQQQSPLQKQMRSAMEHLHRLQTEMVSINSDNPTRASAKPGENGSLRAAKDLSSFTVTSAHTAQPSGSKMTDLMGDRRSHACPLPLDGQSHAHVTNNSASPALRSNSKSTKVEYIGNTSVKAMDLSKKRPSSMIGSALKPTVQGNVQRKSDYAHQKSINTQGAHASSSLRLTHNPIKIIDLLSKVQGKAYLKPGNASIISHSRKPVSSTDALQGGTNLKRNPARKATNLPPNIQKNSQFKADHASTNLSVTHSYAPRPNILNGNVQVVAPKVPNPASCLQNTTGVGPRTYSKFESRRVISHSKAKPTFAGDGPNVSAASTSTVERANQPTKSPFVDGQISASLTAGKPGSSSQSNGNKLPHNLNHTLVSKGKLHNVSNVNKQKQIEAGGTLSHASRSDSQALKTPSHPSKTKPHPGYRPIPSTSKYKPVSAGVRRQTSSEDFQPRGSTRVRQSNPTPSSRGRPVLSLSAPKKGVAVPKSPPTLRVSSSSNGKFVKRLVNGKPTAVSLNNIKKVVPSEKVSDDVWQRYSVNMNRPKVFDFPPRSLKSSANPRKVTRPDKENQICDSPQEYRQVVHNLQKKGVKVNYVMTPKGASSGLV